MSERFEPLVKATREAIYQSPGHTSMELRQALGVGEAPAELQGLVDKIHSSPWLVDDQDWLAPRRSWSEDQLFELVISAAYGAALHRLAAATRALEEACD